VCDSTHNIVDLGSRYSETVLLAVVVASGVEVFLANVAALMRREQVVASRKTCSIPVLLLAYVVRVRNITFVINFRLIHRCDLVMISNPLLISKLIEIIKRDSHMKGRIGTMSFYSVIFNP
jgi:hypothetical protein